MNIQMNLLRYLQAGAVAVSFGVMAPAFAIDTNGWTCVGTCGTQAPVAGDFVTASPVAGSTSYAYVSTNGSAVTNVGLAGVGALPGKQPNPTNGSTFTSSVFTAKANDELSFYFNYVTSDGAGFADYAWARLLDGAGQQVALLFTARTMADGKAVPGQEMPAPTASLSPSTVNIIANANPVWSVLGSSSGTCYIDLKSGCGYTDWVQAKFKIPQAGSYRLEIGAVNWDDQAYDSGLAIDGLIVGGQPPVVTPPTQPGTTVQAVPSQSIAGILATSLGLITAALWLRRRQKS